MLAKNVDQLTAALITDLKQRGMLDDTIVSGQPSLDERQLGEGKWSSTIAIVSVCKLAGGGFKGGHVHGTTDDIGNTIVENPVEVHDLHATVLHQMNRSRAINVPPRRPGISA
ncbi:MAG: DUF1501 domain-containing protein [Nocardioidaceae bacterium]